MEHQGCIAIMSSWFYLISDQSVPTIIRIPLMPALEIIPVQEDPLKHYIKSRDTGPSIRRILIDSSTGLPVDLTDAIALFVATDLAKNAAFEGWATIESPATAGKIRYDFTEDDVETAGVYLAEFQITFSEGQTITYPPANADPDRSYIRLQVVEGLPTAGD